MNKIITYRFLTGYILISLALISISALIIYAFNPFGNNRCIKGTCKNGYGVYLYNSGMVYEGEWKNGRRDGKGILTYPDGTRYEGEWKNNRMHGFGTKTSPILRSYKYIGEWKEGHKYGKGIQYYSYAEWYEGEWKNGLEDGFGIYTRVLRDGSIKKAEGYWKNGKPYKITKTHRL
ncbi:MAG: hypothetical protein QXP41_01955 [Candidatus Nitrosocaldus sp.]